MTKSLPNDSGTANRSMSLEAFLENLPQEEAANARVAAARMDELERSIDGLRDIEHRFMPYAIFSGVLFIIATVTVFGMHPVLGEARRIMGEVGLAAMLGALPALVIVYGFRVRERTRADSATLKLNNAHFLPHGGLYFPASTPDEAARVVLVDKSSEPSRRITKYDHIRPGRIW